MLRLCSLPTLRRAFRLSAYQRDMRLVAKPLSTTAQRRRKAMNISVRFNRGSKAELMAEYPKGASPPTGYMDWHEWAESQKLHGLVQAKCKHCKRWYFPQEIHCTLASAGEKP